MTQAGAVLGCRGYGDRAHRGRTHLQPQRLLLPQEHSVQSPDSPPDLQGCPQVGVTGVLRDSDPTYTESDVGVPCIWGASLGCPEKTPSGMLSSRKKKGRRGERRGGEERR